MNINYLTYGKINEKRTNKIEVNELNELAKKLEQEEYEKIYDEYGPEFFYKKDDDENTYIVYTE